MKFTKSKIAFFCIILYLFPCVCGLLFARYEEKDKLIKIYDNTTAGATELSETEYLIGVVAGEMPADFHTEALKAQSVAARTYLASKKECSNHPGCRICTDATHCQAYKSDVELKLMWGDDYNKYYNKIKSAVESTDNLIAVYDNKPITAVFHSTSSGKTENSEDVWSSSVPYLKSTDSPWDVNSPKYHSTKTMSVEDFKNTIISADANANFDMGLVGDTVSTEGGNINTIVIGGVCMTGAKVRELFDLNSASFVIKHDDNNVYFDVYGYGHGVGMSQYGADYMAQNGADFKEILYKYYKNIDIVSN